MTNALTTITTVTGFLYIPPLRNLAHGSGRGVRFIAPLNRGIAKKAVMAVITVMHTKEKAN
jgi:hypothetical protein